jgi:hypothetical protein
LFETALMTIYPTVKLFTFSSQEKNYKHVSHLFIHTPKYPLDEVSILFILVEVNLKKVKWMVVDINGSRSQQSFVSGMMLRTKVVSQSVKR